MRDSPNHRVHMEQLDAQQIVQLCLLFIFHASKSRFVRYIYSHMHIALHFVHQELL